jgi:hypothetical protein
MPYKKGAFVKRSTTIRQFVDFFLVIGRSVMKFIKISAKAFSGIGRGFSNPFFRSRQIVVLLQIAQLLNICLTFRAAFGQKNCLFSNAYVRFLPE